jgi:hypothetical protein
MGVCGTSRRLTRRAAFHAQDAGGGRHVPHPINAARESAAAIPMEPSPYWGAEPIWDSQSTTHNPMIAGIGDSGHRPIVRLSSLASAAVSSSVTSSIISRR